MTGSDPNCPSAWRLETDDQEVAWLWLDVPGATLNTLDQALLEGLGEQLDSLQKGLPRGLIIASAKPAGFIAGADIKFFSQVTDRSQALEFMSLAHDVFRRLEQFPVPICARIHGHCLGGGLEMALACRYRVAEDTPATRLGLPEVMLGIHPGFGGVARSIRLLGAPAAMELMLSGRKISVSRARRIGLVDQIAAPRHLDRVAREWLLSERPKQAPAWLPALADKPVFRQATAAYLRHQLGLRHVQPEHYPAPYALIDIWSRRGADGDGLFNAERHSVADLIMGDSAQNLVRLFRLQQRLKSLADKAPAKTRFSHVHVIGAGVMGGDIAAWCALQGMQVTLQDMSRPALGQALARARKLAAKKLRKPRLVTAFMDRLQPDSEGLGVPRADVVIEAIVEDARIKQQVFAEIEPRLSKNALLATNTSSIPLSEISCDLENPGRLLGLHFFNPVAKMQLVEIVYGSRTSRSAIHRAAAFVTAIKRLPLPVKSQPGFLVNRVLGPYLMEAVTLLQEGQAAEVIDAAAEEFGMPMGPVELADAVGLDICLHVAENLGLTDSRAIELLRARVESGQLGRKTAAGFYTWHKGKPRKAKLKTKVGSEVTDRLVLVLLNECVAAVAEGIVEDADLADVGMVFGAGFAPFRGGPMHYLEKVGREVLLQRLQNLAKRYGDRFKPTSGW